MYQSSPFDNQCILPVGMRSPGCRTAFEPGMGGRPGSWWARAWASRAAANGFPVFPFAGGSSRHGHSVRAGHPAAGSVQGADWHR